MADRANDLDFVTRGESVLDLEIGNEPGIPRGFVIEVPVARDLHRIILFENWIEDRLPR